ncbi:MAG: hypothetical protein ACR2QA_15285 [Solirubrobacteraceae bacterium]
MSASRYTLGIASLLIVCGIVGFAALTIRRRYLPDWSGAPARLAESVIALALLIGVLQLLGTLGLFSLGPIVGACLLIGIFTGVATSKAGVEARRARARAAQRSAAGPSPRPAPSACAIIAILATAALAAEWAGPTLQSYDVGIRAFDSLWYHLPWAAWFAQTGHVTPPRFTDVEYLTAFYPASAELLHGLGIVLLARDTLSPGINLAWLGLALLAAYCIGRPRGAGWLSLLGAAIALGTPMMSGSQAGSAANDLAGVFFLLAAVALVLAAGDPRSRSRQADEDRTPSCPAGHERAPLLLAALAAGLAISVKLSLLAPVLALSVGAIAIRPAGARLIAAVRWWVPLVLVGGFWYVRNLIAVGDPLPWVSLGIFATPAPPLQQDTAFSVVHYLLDTRIWSQVFEPGLAAGLGPWWAVILIATVLGPALCLLRGADRVARLLGVVALVSIVAYALTPESAAGPAGQPLGFAFNLRYAAPALTLSLALPALAPVWRGARRRAGLAAALVAILVATLAQGHLWPAAHLAGSLALGAAVALAGLLWVRVRRFGGAVPQDGRPRQALLLAGAAVLLVLAVAGYPWQRHYLRGRYAFQPGVSYLARTWALFRGVHGARVGLVGTFGGFFAYPLFGLDDSNRVQYVAHRGPHGSFTAIATCPAWRRAVNAGHFRYLLTTPARDPWHPKALTPSPEGAWTASDPAARLIYSRRALRQPISVYQLRGSLDPAGCR